MATIYDQSDGRPSVTCGPGEQVRTHFHPGDWLAPKWKPSKIFDRELILGGELRPGKREVFTRGEDEVLVMTLGLE